jgi:Arc/MetJ-type ribon-helix-helix transcriptional regulator
MKKICVSLPDEVIEILDKELVGKLGKEQSDVLRTIVLNWLSDQGYLAKGGKQEKPKEHRLLEKHQPENEPFYTS